MLTSYIFTISCMQDAYKMKKEGMMTMDHLRREDCPVRIMQGRTTSIAIGAEGFAAIGTDDAFAGYATFAPKYGVMKPHYHENEIMYIVEAKDAFVRFGDSPDNMVKRYELHAGEIIRARNGEWHIFEFSDETGFLDIIPFFAVPMCHTIEAE